TTDVLVAARRNGESVPKAARADIAFARLPHALCGAQGLIRKRCASAAQSCHSLSAASEYVAQPSGWDLHAAADPVWIKQIGDRTSECKGDEIVDHGGAVSGMTPIYDWWSACLAPFQSQTILRVVA